MHKIWRAHFRMVYEDLRWWKIIKCLLALSRLERKWHGEQQNKRIAMYVIMQYIYVRSCETYFSPEKPGGKKKLLGLTHGQHDSHVHDKHVGRRGLSSQTIIMLSDILTLIIIVIIIIIIIIVIIIVIVVVACLGRFKGSRDPLRAMAF